MASGGTLARGTSTLGGSSINITVPVTLNGPAMGTTADEISRTIRDNLRTLKRVEGDLGLA